MRTDFDAGNEDDETIGILQLACGGVKEAPAVDVDAVGIFAASIALCNDDLVLLGPGIATTSLNLKKHQQQKRERSKK